MTASSRAARAAEEERRKGQETHTDIWYYHKLQLYCFLFCLFRCAMCRYYNIAFDYMRLCILKVRATKLVKVQVQPPNQSSV